ncbi:hypothetical protein C8J56DRAFT_1109064 [Mycena floridula]|nr:hypothetical protein C8J56DRAFT_1109064 [Mycena floridula]
MSSFFAKLAIVLVTVSAFNAVLAVPIPNKGSVKQTTGPAGSANGGSTDCSDSLINIFCDGGDGGFPGSGDALAAKAGSTGYTRQQTGAVGSANGGDTDCSDSGLNIGCDGGDGGYPASGDAISGSHIIGNTKSDDNNPVDTLLAVVISREPSSNLLGGDATSSLTGLLGGGATTGGLLGGGGATGETLGLGGLTGGLLGPAGGAGGLDLGL